MSDFLDRILGVPDPAAVRPRIRSAFEPGPAPAGPWPEPDDLDLTDIPGQAENRGTPGDQAGGKVTGWPATPPGAGKHAPRPVRPAVSGPAGLPAGDSARPSPPRPAPVPLAGHPALPPGHPASAPGGRPPPPALPAAPSHPAAPPSPQPPASRPWPALLPEVPLRGLVRPHPASPPLAATPAARTAVRARVTGEGSRREPVRPADETTVHITIGRLEVRAPSRPAGEASGSSRPTRSPAVPLEEYLRRRSGGAR